MYPWNGIRTGLALEEKESLRAPVVGIDVAVLPGDDSCCCPFWRLRVLSLLLLCLRGVVLQLQSLEFFFHSGRQSMLGVGKLWLRNGMNEQEDLSTLFVRSQLTGKPLTIHFSGVL